MCAHSEEYLPLIFYNGENIRNVILWNHIGSSVIHYLMVFNGVLVIRAAVAALKSHCVLEIKASRWPLRPKVLSDFSRPTFSSFHIQVTSYFPGVCGTSPRLHCVKPQAGVHVIHFAKNPISLQQISPPSLSPSVHGDHTATQYSRCGLT